MRRVEYEVQSHGVTTMHRTLREARAYVRLARAIGAGDVVIVRVTREVVG